jgi:light-regulated signal transduction histidine kinase (bacteriophytochrome)/CheY-like chemotaxis protein
VVFDVHTAANLRQAREQLSSYSFDVIVLYLAGISKLNFGPVRKLRDSYEQVAIVVITESNNEETGIEAIKNGADDYLIRGKIFRDVLVRTIRYGVERRKEQIRTEEILKAEVAERKQIEGILEDLNKQLTETVQKLSESNRSLQEFAHIIAHDLKAPLRAIGTLADWIFCDYHDKLDEQGKHRTKLLAARARRMNDIVDSILRYSEIKAAVSKQEVDLSRLVQSVVGNIKTHDGISIKVSKLPSLVCEKIRIAQVFENLLMNAVKFMNRPNGEVEVTCTEDEDFWKFCVADNGPGIEEKYFDRIFEVFQTLSPRDEVEGSGIGLAVVKRIIEMYGGRVWVESKVGKGSKFFFTLPKSKCNGKGDSRRQLGSP